MYSSPREESRQVRILIVEDNREVRDLLTDLLSGEGWLVEPTPDGPSALQRAREREPSLVLLDMDLPVIPGREVAHQLHALYDGIPILVMTADGHAAQHALHARAFGYLDKPFDLEELLAAIRLGLSRGRRIEHHLESSN